MTLEGEYYEEREARRLAKQGRNPHDIGRRILLVLKFLYKRQIKVAILMTLEGEYYMAEIITTPALLEVAILMTLEGEYYKE